MYTLFYLHGVPWPSFGFIAWPSAKIAKFVQIQPTAHPLGHCIPYPTRGRARASYGGQLLEGNQLVDEKPRHVDHLEDIKAMLMEILFLEATYKHNQPLWIAPIPSILACIC